MALDAKKALASSMEYTNNSIRGITGVLAGKNCTIESIVSIEGGHRVTFKWTADDETERTSPLDVMDGEQGDKGDKGDKGNKGDKGDPGTDGEDGVGIVSIEKTSTVGNVDTYTITLSDGSTTTFTVTNGSGETGVFVTGTLEAGETSITFENAVITSNSTFDFYTDTYGVNPTGVTVASGSITLTFEERESDLGVKVVIK